MTTITCAEIAPKYSNFGQQAERALAYTLTGELRDHGRLPFDQGSDIPEFHMSVKSSGFTLMSGNRCIAQDFEGIVNEYFERVPSHSFAYVTQDMTAYIMNRTEFRNFICRFCLTTHDSQKNGGRVKVQMKKESKKVMAWLTEQVS